MRWDQTRTWGIYGTNFIQHNNNTAKINVIVYNCTENKANFWVHVGAQRKSNQYPAKRTRGGRKAASNHNSSAHWRRRQKNMYVLLTIFHDVYFNNCIFFLIPKCLAPSESRKSSNITRSSEKSCWKFPKQTQKRKNGAVINRCNF